MQEGTLSWDVANKENFVINQCFDSSYWFALVKQADFIAPLYKSLKKFGLLQGLDFAGQYFLHPLFCTE